MLLCLCSMFLLLCMLSKQCDINNDKVDVPIHDNIGYIDSIYILNTSSKRCNVCRFKGMYFKFICATMMSCVSSVLFSSIFLCFSVCLSVWMHAYMYAYMSVCLSVCLSVSRSVSQSFCVSVGLSVCLSACLPVYLPTYLYVCM